MELAKLEQLEVDIEAAPERVAEMLNLIEAAYTRISEIRRRFKADMVAWLEANGDLTVGPIRYYAGVRTDHKPHDHRAVVAAVLEAGGGDPDAIAEVLASSAWKTGAMKKLIGDERFSSLFARVEVGQLKEGKPQKQVLQADTRFLKGADREDQPSVSE
jgi:hypothetical protein